MAVEEMIEKLKELGYDVKEIEKAKKADEYYAYLAFKVESYSDRYMEAEKELFGIMHKTWNPFLHSRILGFLKKQLEKYSY